MRRSGPTGWRSGPWFWLRPRLALAVSIALFAAIFVAKWWVDGDAESISMLYVLPVALLAISFGSRAGVAAGMLAMGLFAVWMARTGATVGPLGWLSQSTLLLIGALVGDATERIRESDRVERQAMEVAVLQREAAEINDSVVQQLAATKWLLETGHVDEAIELLEATMTSAQQLVTRALGSNSVLPTGPRRNQPTEVPPDHRRLGLTAFAGEESAGPI